MKPVYVSLPSFVYIIIQEIEKFTVTEAKDAL
jgi:hypothetical protein